MRLQDSLRHVVVRKPSERVGRPWSAALALPGTTTLYVHGDGDGNVTWDTRDPILRDIRSLLNDAANEALAVGVRREDAVDLLVVGARTGQALFDAVPLVREALLDTMPTVEIDLEDQ